jgi:hypothetical protein
MGGVVDTSYKFVSSVIDTAEQFIAGDEHSFAIISAKI